ncbi:MAG TPA: hypothetical protein PLE99_16355 [Candidatus Thiothrix moscowensis]|uniref:hypothetical protein n=1 Tax=unclassified Thiothrix TaxID=2636184 RepID=UPI0025E90D20|nr:MULTISPECIES: hypothetical protein [unclassified Thiothrix]HRJ54334.1 hypothetical protein [Candidatus Thiothrix moscowensis]HRJ94591.1 hypothetical protein [Candidatus Thiothrix moscowensis]
MDNPGTWLEHLKHPMVLAGFVLFVLIGLLKVFMGSKDLSEANERLLHKGMNFVFVLGVLIIVGGFAFSIMKPSPATPLAAGGNAPAAPVTTGHQSPVVSGSQGDVNINFGTPPAK